MADKLDKTAVPDPIIVAAQAVADLKADFTVKQILATEAGAASDKAHAECEAARVLLTKASTALVVLAGSLPPTPETVDTVNPQPAVAPKKV